MHKFDIGRLAAFTDGVFAIAITLLVLDLDLPDVSEHSVLQLVEMDLPKLYNWLISFFALGTLWLHHHYIVAQLRYADSTVLLYNLFLLLFVSVTPWTTSLIGSYNDQPIAVVLFSGTLGLGWLCIALIAFHGQRKNLLHSDTPLPKPGLITSLVAIRGALIALLSVLLAYAGSSLALLVWLLLFVMHPFVYHR
ncbi:hypothetical protein GCM10007094_01710 [Pseudovibrio japonicus]|uniref:DUF1211 domain-containing protein n=1 Tax=Pseudovibrio japonicus TaxID=366534 RepID=A0ABQ3DVM9_9HYPH|nr:TMEM175 family protein [Pseudovibrio japonicus]GHB17749.1 hypothetical protein GCM10007094_01710 [Pseudovibrio japonicus]